MKLSLVCSVILVAVCLVDNASCAVLSPEPFKVPLQREPLCLADDGEELCKKSQQRASLIRSNYVAAKFANEVKNSVCYLHNAPDTEFGAYAGKFVDDKHCREGIALAEKILKVKTADEFDKMEKLVNEARKRWQTSPEEVDIDNGVDTLF